MASPQERAQRAERSFQRTLQAIERAADLMLLNVFWVVTSLGVVTVFAATGALSVVAQRWAMGDDRAPLPAFTDALRRHWRPFTVVGVGWTALGALLIVDAAIVAPMNEPQRSALLAGLGILALALLAVGLWLPWSALEAQRAREAWATAARAAIGRPAVTLLGIPLLLGVVAVMVLMPLLVLVLPSAAVFAWGSLTKRGHRA